MDSSLITHNWSNWEISWLIADIIFALLATWFLFPSCKIPFWARLLYVAFVWGLNLAGSHYDNNVQWLSRHMYYFDSWCLWVALAAFQPYARRYSWDVSSDLFVQRHQRLLWGVVAAMFLIIFYAFYSMWRNGVFAAGGN
jgi:hypothetical protein